MWRRSILPKPDSSTMLRGAMGIFDFFKKSDATTGDKKGSVPPPGKVPSAKKIASYAKTVSDKRAQTYDRAEAIEALTEMRSPEAAEALLRRFTISIDPSITDQEEKDSAYRGILAAGKDAVPRVLEFCQRAEVLTWGIRILRDLLSKAEYKDELLKLADSFDVEYARNVEPKLQVISALEEVKGDDVRLAVERFLEDANETVRFHAVQTTFAQDDIGSVEPLVKLLESEESIRIKNKVCEGIVVKKWKVPAELVGRAQKALEEGSDYAVGRDGSVSRDGGFSM